MLRRIRGILGTALIWGALWSLAAFAKFARWSILTHFRASTGVYLLKTMRDYGAAGALAGTIFAVAVHYAARRAGSIDALSMSRTALSGAVGGVLVVALTIPQHVLGPGMFVALGFGGLFGAVSAAGSLALARRAPEKTAELGPPDASLAISRRDVVPDSIAR